MSSGDTRLAEEASEARALTTRAFAAGRWAVASEAVSRLAQPIVLLALARVLAPDDFGVVTVATIIVGFAQVFWDAGLTRALVQRDSDSTEVVQAASTIFWANLLLSLVLFAAICAAAVPLAVAFGDPRIVALVRVQALMIPLLAIASVPAALLQRRLQYRPLFVARFAAALAPGLVGLPLALLGAGYWALVVGAITGAVGQGVVLFRLSGWRPLCRWSTAQLNRLAPFTGWSLAEALLSWGILWLDAAIVGLFFTSHELGLYRTGSMAVAMAFGLSIGSLMPVLFAAFSRLQSTPEQLLHAFGLSVKGVAFVAMGLTSVAVAAPHELSAIAFGPQWRGMGSVVFYLAIMQGVSWLVAPNAEVYRALGRPDLNLKINATCLSFYIPVFVWAARSGLDQLLQARMVVALIAFAIHLAVARSAIRMTVRRFTRCIRWFAAAGIASALMGTAVNLSTSLDLLPRTLAVLLACGFAYLLVCLGERSFLMEFARQWQQKGASP